MPSKFYSVLGNMIKFSMMNNLKMGSKLVMGNRDLFQLQPANRSSMQMPSHALFQHNVLLLVKYACSRSDPIL